MLKNFIKNLSNIPGWRTNRKIVVIESDDWGSLRMSSIKAYQDLKNKGVSLDKGAGARYNQYDTLALFFASFSNIASYVPSGGRFVALSNFLLATSFLFFLNHQIKVHRLIKIGMSLAILGYLIFRIREGLDYVGVFLFIGNPVINWFIDDTPLIETIKSML